MLSWLENTTGVWPSAVALYLALHLVLAVFIIRVLALEAQVAALLLNKCFC